MSAVGVHMLKAADCLFANNNAKEQSDIWKEYDSGPETAGLEKYYLK